MNAERYLEQFETLSRRIAYHREHLLMLHLELDQFFALVSSIFVIKHWLRMQHRKLS